MHVRWNRFLDTPSLFINDAELLELPGDRFDALAGLLELLLLKTGHFLFVVDVDRGPGELFFFGFVRHVRRSPLQQDTAALCLAVSSPLGIYTYDTMDSSARTGGKDKRG